MAGVVVSGAVTGILYALIGCGLALIYRSSGTLNLAIGPIAGVAAFVALVDWAEGGTPSWLLLLVGLVLGAMISLAAYLATLWQIERRSALSASIASLGLALIANAASVQRWGTDLHPVPAVRLPFEVRLPGLRIGGTQGATLVVGVLMLLALALLVQRTSLGLALRAVGQGPLTASTQGIALWRVRTAAWGAGGLLAAAAALLGAPSIGLVPGTVNLLLVGALAGLVIGGFDSLLGVSVGGVVLGVGQNLLVYYLTPLLQAAALFVIVAVLLTLRPQGLIGWHVPPLREPALPSTAGLWFLPFPAGCRVTSGVDVVVLAVVLALVAVVTPFLGSGMVAAFQVAAAEAVILLGMVVVVGLSGQLSLGQGAFAAIGGYVAAVVESRAGADLAVAIPVAMVTAGAVGLLPGVLCIRLKTIYLAVLTFVFATAVTEVAVHWTAVTGGSMGLSLPPAAIAGLPLGSGQRYVDFEIAVLALVGATVTWLRRSRYGRAWILMRDSPEAAIAAGIPIAPYRVAAFVVAAALAALGGVLYTHAIDLVSPDVFDFTFSLNLVVGLVLGGVESVGGAIAGAAFLAVVPQLTGQLGQWPDVVFGAALIVVLTFMPEGISSLLVWLMTRMQKIGGPMITDTASSLERRR